jgi:hypothetical protein
MMDDFGTAGGMRIGIRLIRARVIILLVNQSARKDKENFKTQ